MQADVDNALAHGAVLYRDVKETNLGGDYPIRIAFVVGPNGELIEFFKEL